MRDMIHFIAAAILYLVAFSMLPACSQIVYTSPDGQRASYTRFGNQQISGLRIERDELGHYRVVLDKQQSDADSTINAIRELIR